MPPDMTPAELERWKTRQVQALINAGQNPIDASNQVARFLAKLPAGADPDHYVPRDNGGVDVSGKAILDDMRADWYGKVDATHARLLDAKGVE